MAPQPVEAADPLTLNQRVGDSPVSVQSQSPGIEPGSRATALRQATALADLTVAEAGDRLVLDWTQHYRHATPYKAVFRPAVLPG